jgi:hypothetical protein
VSSLVILCPQQWLKTGKIVTQALLKVKIMLGEWLSMFKQLCLFHVVLLSFLCQKDIWMLLVVVFKDKNVLK